MTLFSFFQMFYFDDVITVILYVFRWGTLMVIIFKGNLLQNNNKKCVFWKLTHCRGLKCFIKESRTQKVKVLEKHEKDVARSGFEPLINGSSYRWALIVCKKAGVLPIDPWSLLTCAGSSFIIYYYGIMGVVWSFACSNQNKAWNHGRTVT